ncbi:MAG: YIP1 family protein [Desulfomonilaceae bacterium]
MFCPKCGREYNPDEDARFCPSCGNPLPLKSFPQGTGSGDESGRHEAYDAHERDMARAAPVNSCPWENIEELGFLQAIGATLKQSLLEPVRFFTAMPRTGGWLHPLLYAIIIGTTGNLAGYVLGALFEIPLISQSKLSPGMTLFVGMLMPLLVWLGVMLWAVVLHGAIILFGAKKNPFEATLRITSYASSPDILNVIPTVGWVIAAVWKIVLVIIGVREVHRVSTGRAALAVLFPVLLVWGLLFTIFLVAMATMAFHSRPF